MKSNARTVTGTGALVAALIVTGCGDAPDGPSAQSVPSKASRVDPFDVVTTDFIDDPPPLHAAIADGELQRVQDLLAAGEEVNYHDPVYGTPLVAALQTGDEKLISVVREAGAKNTATSDYFVEAGELPEKVADRTVRAVADQFAKDNQLTLRVHEQLSALFLFDVADARGQALVEQHRDALLAKGWFVFRFAHDARRREDVIGLLPAANKYVAIAYLQTDGLNYNISTERIIDWLQRLEQEEPLVVTEVGLDFLGGRFLQPIKNPREMARRIFEFCPDIVDQGIGTVANLEKELAKPSPQLYLWWD